MSKKITFSMVGDGKEIVIGEELYDYSDDDYYDGEEEETKEWEMNDIINQFKVFLQACRFDAELVNKVGLLTPDVVAKYQLTEK